MSKNVFLYFRINYILPGFWAQTVIFSGFFSTNEKYLKQVNYTNLNYFRDREKIGLILENENNIEDKLKQLTHEKQNFKKSILEIRNKISPFVISFDLVTNDIL